MKKVVIYGIPNCDVTNKAIAWLNKNNIKFDFYDYKKQGISIERLTGWANKKSWQLLLNKRGTTWKSLDHDLQKKIINQDTAIELMQQHISLIKRPVAEVSDLLLIGFDEAGYKTILQNHK